jgi:hypothetical protein
MPLRAITRAAEGTAEPASTTLSPVARDYPSPRFRRVFHAAVRLAVLSRNEGDSGKSAAKSHGFLPHKLFTDNTLVSNR